MYQLFLNIEINEFLSNSISELPELLSLFSQRAPTNRIRSLDIHNANTPPISSYLLPPLRSSDRNSENIRIRSFDLASQEGRAGRRNIVIRESVAQMVKIDGVHNA